MLARALLGGLLLATAWGTATAEVRPGGPPLSDRLATAALGPPTESLPILLTLARPADDDDGHFVMFNHEDTRRRYRQFLGTAVRNGVPTLVE